MKENSYKNATLQNKTLIQPYCFNSEEIYFKIKKWILSSTKSLTYWRGVQKEPNSATYGLLFCFLGNRTIQERLHLYLYVWYENPEKYSKFNKPQGM